VLPLRLRKYYVKNNNLLDQNRLPEEVLAEKLAIMGEYDYAGQYGQTPTPPKGGLFKVGRIHVVDMPPPDREFETIVRYWDKAATEDGGCRTAGVKMGFKLVGMTQGLQATKGHPRVLPRPIYDVYLLDSRIGQWATDDREAEIDLHAQAD